MKKTCFNCKYRNAPIMEAPCRICRGAVRVSDGMTVRLSMWEPAVVQTENDPLNPKHYTDGKIEVIDFIEDKKLGFCLGNAIKYISRAGKKDPTKEVEDLRKAIWYLERRIKELEEVST